MHAEPSLAVAPGSLAVETTLAENAFHHLVGVFVTVFGVDALARRERQIQIQRRYEHALFHDAFQIDLHAKLTPIPQRDVAKLFEMEVGVQFPV